MKPIKDKITGAVAPLVGEYPIATNTAVKAGQAVVLTAGKVVALAVDGTGAMLGVAAEAHSGAASALNQRDNGLKILVHDSPAQIFTVKPAVITATGGTTTTIISTSGFAAESGTSTFVDDDFNGGYAKLVSKVAASTNTDAIGTIYAISDHDAGDRTLTINTAGGAVTAGDKFEIYPPIGFQKANLDAAHGGLVYTAVAALPIKSVGYDFDRGLVLVYPTLHFYGNKFN